MTDNQEAFELRGALRRAAVAGALALAMSACAAPSDQAAEEEFPTLAEVPAQPPATTAPEERQTIVEELEEDRAEATYTQPDGEPAPLETAAPRDPFASSLIISGDSVTSSDQVAGLPLQTAAGPGQLAAIVFFGHGSAELDGGDRSVLRDVAALREQRGGSLRVVGHASSRTHNTTPDEHQIANFDMSLSRANAVLEELLRLGVPADAARAEAVGDAEPVYHEFMPSGEAGNRRAEIFLEN
jgi:outer membrane protein OmpA-like peptidoglycan-associated protein